MTSDLEKSSVKELDALDFLLLRQLQLAELKKTSPEAYRIYLKEFRQIARHRRLMPKIGFIFQIFQHLLGFGVVIGGFVIAYAMVWHDRSADAVWLVASLDILVSVFLGLSIYQTARSKRNTSRRELKENRHDDL